MEKVFLAEFDRVITFNKVVPEEEEQQQKGADSLHITNGMDSEPKSRRAQRQQLFAAAAAGNLSPIPSDSETGDHLNNDYEEEEDDDRVEADINSIQPPEWPETPDGSLVSVSSNDSLENISDTRKYTIHGDEDEEEEAEELRRSSEKSKSKSIRSSRGESNNIAVEPTEEAAPAKRKGAKIVMPKLPPKQSEKSSAKMQNHTSSPRKPLAKSSSKSSTTTSSSSNAKKAPMKSRLPKMEQVISNIPKPKPKRQLQQPRPTLASCGSSGGSLDSVEGASSKKGSSSGLHHDPRENKSSMQRKKQLQVQLSRDKEEEEKDLDYLTPLQKKNQHIKDIEKELKDVRATLEAREKDLKEADSFRASEIRFIVHEKKAEIQVLEERVAELEAEKEELQKKHDEAISTMKAYEKSMKEFRAKIEKKEVEMKEMYLVMYKKGQQSALFDRQVQVRRPSRGQLEELAAKAPQSVDVKELLAKLEKTQGELTKWQSIQRSSSYDQGDRPDTEAAATLRFLRDSMFHYLSDDGRDQAQHLKAMISILGFTEVQMKKIKKAMIDHHK